MSSVAILGAGMAGFGAAYQLHQEDIQTDTFDKRPHIGGHTSSLVTESGFVFDEGPHISFTKNERMQNLLAEFVGHEFETLTAQANNYWKGYWIKHPAQCNLYGLPTDLVVKVLRDFIEAQQKLKNGAEPEIKNYEDWLLASYGETFARTFPMEYGLRYHTTTADNMTTEWLGPRLYRPDLEEVLFGALSPSTPDVHYISHFRYPSKGGFYSYLRPFEKFTRFHPGHKVTSINPRTGEIRFAGGKVAKHDAIISSIPLPDLIPMIEGAPGHGEGHNSGQGAGGRGRGVEAIGLHEVCRRQPGHRSGGHFSRKLDLLLRSGFQLYARQLPSHVFPEQCAAGNGQHSGRALLL